MEHSYNNYPILMKTKVAMNLSSSSSMYSFNSPLGLVWPPRSYSCSFCRREFRSAQALGGHMNVHRRDRAKLKRSNISTCEEIINPAAFSNLKTTEEESTRKLNLVDKEVVMCKRYKKSGVPFLYCASSSSVEEIDLELRLGDPSAVK